MGIRQYANGTSLTTGGMWDVFTGGRAECADGKVRALKRIAATADTYFSVPAAVEVHGKTVTGYVSVETVSGSSVATDDDPPIVRFRAFTYRKNHAAIQPRG